MVSALEDAGLPVNRRNLSAYAHQLSGGERQRVAIAQVLACRPRLIIADEPTSSLDAALESEILELLKDLKRGSNLALLLITHNPANLEGLADRVLVMSEGRIVESGETALVFRRPEHRYTRAMLESFELLHGHNPDREQRCLKAPADGFGPQENLYTAGWAGGHVTVSWL